MLSVKFKVMKLKLLPVLAIASSSTDQFCCAQSMVQYAQPMAGSGVVTTPAAFKYGSDFALFANTIPVVITPFAMIRGSLKHKPQKTNVCRHLIIKTMSLVE